MPFFPGETTTDEFSLGLLADILTLGGFCGSLALEVVLFVVVVLVVAVTVVLGLNVLVLVVMRVRLVGPESLRLLEFLVNVLALLDKLTSSSSFSLFIMDDLGGLGLEVLADLVKVLILDVPALVDVRVSPLFRLVALVFRALLVG